MTQNTTSTSQRNRIVAIAGGCAVVALCLCVAGAAAGGGYYYFTQQGQATANGPAVEYILDASPRMDAPLEGSTRFSQAQAVLAEVVRPADPTVAAGLRVFGSGAVATACEDTDLLVPLAPSNQTKIADSALGLQPGAASDSALAQAMLAAIRDLAAQEGPHTLVVVTGGADACNEQAGQLIKQEADKAGIKLQEFVIGFAVSAEEADVIKSMVEESGGDYLDAPDTATLNNILIAIQNHVDNPSSTSIALIDTAATPGAVLNLPTPESTGTGPIGGPTSESVSPGDVTATPEGTTGNYQSQTACDQPYFPLRTGATWNYSSSDGFSYTWVVNSVAGDLNSATANVSYIFDQGTVTYDWTCNADGVTYFMGGTVATEGGTATVTVNNLSGASILAGNQMVPGATWSSGYDMTMDISVSGVSVSSTTSTSETHSAGDIQSLTNGAGTFDVLPVTTNSDFTTTNSAGSFSSSSSSVSYFAYGVGLIRTETSFDGGSMTYELVSYSVP